MSAQEQHIASRSDDAYAANERLARRAEALRFVSRVPMFCECDDPRCGELVLITLERYREVRVDATLRLTAPGHRLGRATSVVQGADFWIHRAGGDSAS